MSSITNEEVVANSEYSIKLEHPALVKWLRQTYDVANLGMGILPRDGIRMSWYDFNHCGSSWYMFLDTDEHVILQCHASLSTGEIYAPQSIIDNVDQIITCGTARMVSDKVVQFKNDVVFSTVFGDTMYNMSVSSSDDRCREVLEYQNSVTRQYQK